MTGGGLRALVRRAAAEKTEYEDRGDGEEHADGFPSVEFLTESRDADERGQQDYADVVDSVECAG